MKNNVNIQLYSSCNCDCSFCCFKDNLNNKIDPQFVLEYLKQNPQIDCIVITGGEPTLAIEEYKEIVENIDTAQKNVILQTNGWWADDDKIKNTLKQCPPSLVQLSVDYEKQKKISIETITKAYIFLKENDIRAVVVNHTNDKSEFEYYSKLFENIRRGVVCSFDGEHTYDCGISLLATNKVGKLDIFGWEVQ